MLEISLQPHVLGGLCNVVKLAGRGSVISVVELAGRGSVINVAELAGQGSVINVATSLDLESADN